MPDILTPPLYAGAGGTYFHVIPSPAHAPEGAVLLNVLGDWMADGLCAQTDPEAFFPEKGASSKAAKQVCRACEVRAQCLEYALGNNIHFGVWGGLTERERRRLKRATV
ncbi:WhiB family transcriptional regulator [Nonomuraea sp. CA-143628]|uniref:WhiB family transcriptional regulator n=1 Tax=Nonomuraea sp. CA-143628 TaxID=3239997 RepID=UPI003D920870